MIAEVVPGIYSVEHQVAEGKNAIIFSQRGAWAIDTGTYPAEGQAMADFIRQRGYMPNRLLLTHGHGDHVLGSTVFREADVIAHTLTLVEISTLTPHAGRASGSFNGSVDRTDHLAHDHLCR